MMEYRNVIVLQDAQAVRDNLVQELAKWDFAVRSCGSLSGFRHLYALHPSPLVVLTGESNDLARCTEHARAAAPLATIIALGMATDTNANWRVRIMAAGADACHAASIEIIELAAILSSWARHAARLDRAIQAVQAVYGTVQRESAAGAASRGDARAAGHPDSSGKPRYSSASAKSGRPGHSNRSRNLRKWRNSSNSGAWSKSGNSDNAVSSAPMSYRLARLGAGWRLDVNCRVLVCPRDQTLLLTGAETDFLKRIAASESQLLRRRRPGNSVIQGVETRDAEVRNVGIRDVDIRDVEARGVETLHVGARSFGIGDIAAGDAEAGGAGIADAGVVGTGAQGIQIRDVELPDLASRDCTGQGDDRGEASSELRGIDVLVSRLRRKARREGIELPLLAVRGCGYLFAEYLTVAPCRPVRPVARASRLRLSLANAPVRPASVRSLVRPFTPTSDLSANEIFGVPPEALATVPA